MPIFPPVVSLLAPPSGIWSLAKVVSANVPIISSDYTLAHLVDGTCTQATRFAFDTLQVTIDLGVTRTPNIFGVLNHNFDPGLVVGVSNEAGLSRGFGVRDPHCWIDLRGFPTTARYWTLSVNANSIPVSLGEIVIATGAEFSGMVESEPSEDVVFHGTRDTTEYGKVYLSATGALSRRTPFNLRVPQAQRAILQAIDLEVGIMGGRVLVVPTTARNDIWFTEWPSLLEYTHADQIESSVPLDLIDESSGVVYGR